jgi:hypothetical protein
MTAIGASILAIVLSVVLFAPKRWAIIGIMGGVFFITQGQVLEIMGVNMYAIRFVGLAAFSRVMVRRECTFSKLTRIDKTLLLLFAFSTAVFLLRSKVEQMNKIGAAIDACLCYFAFRGLVEGVEGFRWFLWSFLLILVPYTVLVLVESLTKANPFAFMGGVIYGDWVREGRLRCQGTFRNASLLGSVAASFLPLYIGLWFSKTYRNTAALGIGLCLLIVWASNSGGPASAAGFAMVGWACYRLRSNMKFVRRSLVVGFIALAVVMKAPVWYLLAKISSVSGGAGWHRAHLLDMAFQNLDKWWLCGMAIGDTADWFPYVLSITGGADITNQFLAFGIDAGVVAMLLFFALLVQAYQRLGQSLAGVRHRNGAAAAAEPMLWGLGVMLTVHCINWMGITYFDQSYVIWYFHLALIVNLTESCCANHTRKLENSVAEALESDDFRLQSGRHVVKRRDGFDGHPELFGVVDQPARGYNPSRSGWAVDLRTIVYETSMDITNKRQPQNEGVRF